ncbi:plectin isoform X3 [Seriola aureovittata]|uniref:plectin isoform X3 n=1 Tax=Seriola aureovittata TaxID=2871759 RepID=UPI0024BEFD8C|nr:plectin isoform X3 [Seriola aureovittata]
MGTQGPGRKRIPNREKLTAEDDALNQIAREAEARLAAKRAARAEAREIRMKELERQQKELFHSHKKYYGLDNKWGHIEQWMISDDEERMSVGSRGSLRVSPHHHVDLVSVSRPPSDYSGFLGSSSRASSRASSARASPVVEERPDRDFLDKGSRTASTLSAATLASLGGASSRRGSCDTSFSVETEASIREIKDSLVEAEDRYRKAMVSNAQLHNDKSTLMYQVDTLREELSDMEEELWEARRHCDHTTKELERERQAHKVLQFQFKEMKETLKQMEELLTEVSELRVKSSSYCQEVCDLQEALQWKEKKISALERQREISDMVQMERERLRQEVIRLRDLLKKHAVIVSPDVSTNGEAGQGEVESDVGEQSDSRLAEEPLRGGRESMLGKAVERQPAEGSKHPQDDMKNNTWSISKCSQSLSVVSTGEQTKHSTLKQVKGTDKLSRDTRDRANKHPGRNKRASKPPQKCRTRQDGDVRTVQTKQTTPGAGAARFMMEDQALKSRTKADKSPKGRDVRADTSAVSLQDVHVMEIRRSFDDKTYNIQTNLTGTQPEGQATCEQVVSPVHRASPEKVLKSRLVPPRPIKDMILDNKAIVLSLFAAGKQNSLTLNKQKPGGGNVTSASEGHFTLKCLSVDQSFQKDGKTSRDGECSHSKLVADISALCIKENKIKEINPSTSADSFNEDECVEKVSEVDGQSLENEDTKSFTDLSENETLVFTGPTSQSFKHQQHTVSEDWRRTLHEAKASETKLETSERDAFLPAEMAITGGRLNKLEVKKQRIHDEEAAQLQEDISSERSKCKDPTKPLRSSAVSPFVPSELLKEKTVQTILRGFAENQSFVAEISRIVPEIPESPNLWISELEDTLKKVAGNVLNQQDGADQASLSQKKHTSKSELPVKDLPEGARTPEDPEDVGASAPTLKDSSVPGALEVPFLEGQTYHVFVVSSISRSKVCEDIEDLREEHDRAATGKNFTVVSSTCHSELEVVESLLEEKSAENSEENQSEHDSEMTSCSEDFVFVESYFAEPVKTRAVESASDQPSVGESTNPKKLEGIDVVDSHVAEVDDQTHEQRQIVGPSQSCLVFPVEDPKDTQLKRHGPIWRNSPVDQSSKIRRLIEITAAEIKAMAVPELTLMSLEKGRVVDDRRSKVSHGSDADDVEETSVENMDSCEEADEDA